MCDKTDYLWWKKFRFSSSVGDSDYLMESDFIDLQTTFAPTKPTVALKLYCRLLLFLAATEIHSTNFIDTTGPKEGFSVNMM